LTATTFQRRSILDYQSAAEILKAEWSNTLTRHGWSVGRYVIMPDHVHFFARPAREAKPLFVFMRLWKEWTSKRLILECDFANPIGQAEFSDHVLRSNENYGLKWTYVRNNPVRAGLVAKADDWPWQGEMEQLTL
jgi:putative transposase